VESADEAVINFLRDVSWLLVAAGNIRIFSSAQSKAEINGEWVLDMSLLELSAPTVTRKIFRMRMRKSVRSAKGA